MVNRAKLKLSATALWLATSFTLSPATAVVPGSEALPPEAVKLCDQGSDAADYGSYDKAISLYKEAIKIAPSYRRLVENLSAAFCQKGGLIEATPEQALGDYDQALFYNADNAKALSKSADMIRMLGKNPRSYADRISLADQAAAAKDYPAAVIEYEKALAITENSDIRGKLEAAIKASGPRPPKTEEVRFNTYMTGLQTKIKKNWKPPHANAPATAPVFFVLDRDGHVRDVHMSRSTGIAVADSAAISAVRAGAPYDPLPEGAPRSVDINFTFQYNVRGTSAGYGGTAISPSDQSSLLKASREAGLLYDLDAFKKSSASKDDYIKTVAALSAFYIACGEDDKAEKLLKAQIEEEQKTAPKVFLSKLLNDLGELYCRAHRYEDADEVLKKSIALCESDKDFGIFETWRAYKDYAALLKDTGKTDQSITYKDKAFSTLNQGIKTLADYDAAITADHQNPVNYFLRGNLHLHKSEWQAAIDDYTQAISFNPQYTLAYCQRAAARRRLKQYVEAIQDLDQAQSLDTFCASPYRGRGLVYNQQKQWSQAVKEFDEALRIDKMDFDSLIGRGTANLELKQYQQASDDYAAATKIRPQDPICYTNQALVSIHRKRYDEAMNLLNTAVRLGMDNAQAYSNRGLVFSRLKDYPHALKDINQALELDKNDTVAHLNKGNCLLHTGQFATAKDEFSEAIRERNDYTLAYSNRSCANWLLGDYPAALADANKALEINSKFAPALCNRGKVHYSLKEYDAALADINKAIEIEPSVLEGEPYYYRSLVNTALGKTIEAADDAARAKAHDYVPLKADK